MYEELFKGSSDVGSLAKATMFGDWYRQLDIRQAHTLGMQGFYRPLSSRSLERSNKVKKHVLSPSALYKSFIRKTMKNEEIELEHVTNARSQLLFQFAPYLISQDILKALSGEGGNHDEHEEVADETNRYSNLPDSKLSYYVNRGEAQKPIELNSKNNLKPVILQASTLQVSHLLTIAEVGYSKIAELDDLIPYTSFGLDAHDDELELAQVWLESSVEINPNFTSSYYNWTISSESHDTNSSYIRDIKVNPNLDLTENQDLSQLLQEKPEELADAWLKHTSTQKQSSKVKLSSTKPKDDAKANVNQDDKLQEAKSQTVKPKHEKTSATPSAATYKKQGKKFTEEGKINEAIDAYNKAVKVDSKDVEAHNNLGNLYKESKQVDLAKSEYMTVISICQKQLKTYKKIGIDSTKVIDKNKNLATAYNNLGVVYQIEKDSVKADEMYKKSLNMLQSLGNQNDIEINKILATTHYNLASMLYKQAMYVEAKDHYKQATDLYDKEGIYHIALALMYVKQTKETVVKSKIRELTDKAISEYKKAYALTTDSYTKAKIEYNIKVLTHKIDGSVKAFGMEKTIILDIVPSNAESSASQNQASSADKEDYDFASEDPLDPPSFNASDSNI